MTINPGGHTFMIYAMAILAGQLPVRQLVAIAAGLIAMIAILAIMFATIGD